MTDLDDFRSLLDRDPTPGRQKEQELQDFMEQHSEFLPCPYLQNHDVHHRVFISKLPLASHLITDLVYLTKSSDSWWVVLVELEDSRKQMFTSAKTATEHSLFTAALAQVKSWREHLKQHDAEVMRKLRPLLVPLGANPVHFKFALVYGRDKQKANDAQLRARIDDIATEQKIAVWTYDTIIRRVEANRGKKLHVLSHKSNRFAFKRIADAPTSIFSYVAPEHLSLQNDQAEHWKTEGYDIDSWQSGELLILGKNGKWLPRPNQAG